MQMGSGFGSIPFLSKCNAGEDFALYPIRSRAMDITVQGIFGSPTQAWPLVDTIRNQIPGVKKVALIVKGEQIEEEQIPRQTNRGVSFALFGALAGMLLGALIASILPVGTGTNQLVRDTVYGALMGMVGGAVLGYFLGGLFIASMMSNEAKNMTTALEHGDVVLRAEVEPTEAAQVCEVLIAGGARRSDGTPGVERSDDRTINQNIN